MKKTTISLGILIILLLVIGTVIWYASKGTAKPIPEVAAPVTTTATNPTAPVVESTIDKKIETAVNNTIEAMSKIDADFDNLSDADEINTYRTNQNNADTDGDGLLDGDEVKLFHTDPLKRDTDGDGFPDAEEVQNGYNPLGPGRLKK